MLFGSGVLGLVGCEHLVELVLLLFVADKVFVSDQGLVWLQLLLHLRVTVTSLLLPLLHVLYGNYQVVTVCVLQAKQRLDPGTARI